jgi:hypothetical protein
MKKNALDRAIRAVGNGYVMTDGVSALMLRVLRAAKKDKKRLNEILSRSPKVDVQVVGWPNEWREVRWTKRSHIDAAIRAGRKKAKRGKR